jgi:hypothetical protein
MKILYSERSQSSSIAHYAVLYAMLGVLCYVISIYVSVFWSVELTSEVSKNLFCLCTSRCMKILYSERSQSTLIAQSIDVLYICTILMLYLFHCYANIILYYLYHTHTLTHTHTHTRTHTDTHAHTQVVHRVPRVRRGPVPQVPALHRPARHLQGAARLPRRRRRGAHRHR